MGTIASLVDRWPMCQSRSARVQTIAGHWMTAEVRGRTAETEVEHVIVLQDVNGTSAVGVPVKAVTGRFLRLVAKDGAPGPEFGPVDVAVLRRRVREAAALPAWQRGTRPRRRRRRRTGVRVEWCVMLPSMVGGKAAKRVGLEVLGWTLVVLGIAGLILPGPGLLGLFAGLFVLSQQYEWAERRVEPVKLAAFRAAAEGVQSWPRIIVSLLGVVFMVGVGVVWGMRPPAPGFWPVDDKWWLFGGWPTGITLIVSAFIALVLIIFSYQKFHGVEDPIAAAEEAARDKN